MSWVIRRGRAYEYRSIRRGGKVTSEYVGGGSIPAESAEFFHSLEAGRRTERATSRADWEVERGRLDEAERRSIERDTAYDELATVALIATGHHRPQRGRWRRRRPMATKGQAKGRNPIGGEPIDTAAEMEGLLDRADRAEGEEKLRLDRQVRDVAKLHLEEARMGLAAALPVLRVVLRRHPEYFSHTGLIDFVMDAMVTAAGGKDVFARDLFRKDLEDMRSDLAGPSPSPLERILAERIALAWFDVNEADRRWASVSAEGCSFEKADYHQRYRTRANQRFLAACKTLATVRRLALPVLQVKLGGGLPAKPPRVPGFSASLDRCLSSHAE